MARVAVNGAELEVTDEGQGGPPFVFVHGWACDSSVWAPQAENFARDHRTLNINLRGRGGSAAAPPYDAQTAADDVAAVIRALDVGPAVIVGHSLGGIVALLVNERHPDVVLGITMGDPPLNWAAAGDFETLRRRISEAGSMQPAERVVESFFTESTPPAVREHVRRMILECPPDVAAGMLADSDAYAGRLDDLIRAADQKPFMAIWPSRPLGDPAHLRDIAVFLRQEPVPGAGHFFQLERPEIASALLRAFLDDVERDPRLNR